MEEPPVQTDKSAKSKQITLSVVVSKDLEDKAKLEAKRNNHSTSSFLREIIEERVTRGGHGSPSNNEDLVMIKNRLKSLEATIEEMSHQFSRLRESINFNKSVRQEMFDALSVIAKYTPATQAQMRIFAETINTESQNIKTAAEKLNQFISKHETSLEIIQKLSLKSAHLEPLIEKIPTAIRTSIQHFDNELSAIPKRVSESIKQEEVAIKRWSLKYFLPTVLSVSVITAITIIAFKYMK